MRDIDFAECLLLTDAMPGESGPGIRLVRIDRLNSAHDYSRFVLTGLSDHIATSHCLLVQWDGFVLEASRWNDRFLRFDYIGAPWPQFTDGHDVGNGGFSLRSKKLLEACRDRRFQLGHPEDVAICRTNRDLLEREFNVRFADRGLAEHFSFERAKPAGPTFGFHGIFNMIPAIGPDRFWEIYRGLDDRSTMRADYALLMKQLSTGSNSAMRRVQLTTDRLALAIRR